jgi:hypothetical protein
MLIESTTREKRRFYYSFVYTGDGRGATDRS